LTRQAQISQVFTYLIIILVIGVIVIFGYKGITWILQSQCEHQRAVFEKSILDLFDEYTDKGSVHEETLKAPCTVEEVCFIDSQYYDLNAPPLDITLLGGDAVLKSAVDDRAQNVFFKTKFTEPIGFSNKIALRDDEQPYKCFKPKSGEFKFLFTGLGKKTRIESGWQQ
jgi:hypothetical protein